MGTEGIGVAQEVLGCLYKQQRSSEDFIPFLERACVSKSLKRWLRAKKGREERKEESQGSRASSQE